MGTLDSPVLVALITVTGSIASTFGAILLNRKTRSSPNEMAELLKVLKERDDTIKKMGKP